jgi:hypothetical protein
MPARQVLGSCRTLAVTAGKTRAGRHVGGDGTSLAYLTCSKFGETMCRSVPSALTASRSSGVSFTGLCVTELVVV